MSLGLPGLGREDIMQHMLNYIWPNILEVALLVLVDAVGVNAGSCEWCRRRRI